MPSALCAWVSSAREAGQLRSGGGLLGLGVLPQALGDLIQAVEVGPGIGKADVLGDHAIEPADEPAGLVTRQPVVALPEVHEEGVAPVGGALLGEFLLAQAGLLRGVAGGALGLLGAGALGLIGGIGIQAGLGPGPGLVHLGGGGLHLGGTLGALGLQGGPRLPGGLDLALQVRQGGLALLQELGHLGLGLVQMLDQGPVGDQIHPQPGQLAVVLGLGQLHLGDLGIGGIELGLDVRRLGAGLVQCPVDGG